MLIVLVGKSASGKTTLEKYISDNFRYEKIVSHTTRPKRESETDGVEHYFIDNFTASRMLATIDGIAAYTKIGNYRYFSTIEEVMHSDIYIIDPNGLKNLYLGNNAIKIIPIYITCNIDVAYKRAVKRGDDIEAFEARVIAESKQFADYKDYAYKIENNDDLNHLYAQVDTIIAEISNLS